MLDVDRFKHINDKYGHTTGDRAIQAVGDILKDATKKNGMCFRYGGDEFIVVLKVTAISQIDELIDSINRLVDEFNAKSEEVFTLSLSSGYAIYEVGSDSVVTFIEKMDAAMYEFKRETHRCAAAE